MYIYLHTRTFIQAKAPQWITLLHDSFRLSVDNWMSFMVDCPNYAIDTHIYQAWYVIYVQKYMNIFIYICIYILLYGNIHIQIHVLTYICIYLFIYMTGLGKGCLHIS
jgi:hypothetical protein